MVELCFNQSAQGALKMAQHCGGKGRHSVGTVFCTSEDGEKPSRRAVRAQMRKVRAEQDRLDRYAALLAGLDARVTLVSLPRWWERPDGAVVRWERGWGEVHPEEFGLHLGGAEELTRPVLRMLALEWERLREENAPLRAVVNGRVMGVSEDFYDPVLRRCFTEKPQKVANVLGQALVQLSGVGDWLLARRLRAMAEAGAVRVDEAGSTRGFYGAAVCLA